MIKIEFHNAEEITSAGYCVNDGKVLRYRESFVFEDVETFNINASVEALILNSRATSDRKIPWRVYEIIEKLYQGKY